jgi:hypothetical protein
MIGFASKKVAVDRPGMNRFLWVDFSRILGANQESQIKQKVEK